MRNYGTRKRTIIVFNIYCLYEQCTVGHWSNRVTASGIGQAELYDVPRSGRPVTAVNPEMLHCPGTIVCED
jgi:hypothetical protein